MSMSPLVPSRRQLMLVGGLASAQRTMDSLGLATWLVAWKKKKARARDTGGGDTGHWTDLAPPGSRQLPWRATGATISPWTAGESAGAVAFSVADPAANGRKANDCWLLPAAMETAPSGAVQSASE